MKEKLKIFGLLFVAGFSYAQTINLSTSENYIYTKNCLNEDCSKKTEAVQYSDGLGRIKQTISIKSSPTGKDIAVPIEYDQFGRQVKSYLPIPQPGTQNGAIYSNPKANASPTYGSDLYFYSESVLENSPSAKLLSQTKPGMDYHGHSINYGYEMNTANDVKKYIVSTSWVNKATDNSISVSGTYNAGELIKTSVTEENGNKIIEFKNGKGQTILARKMVSSSQNADTYYVYNKYEQLAFVIPPLAASQAITTTLLNDLCYQYRYDSKGRQTEKKLPGKGWEYIIYDKQDRVLMTQDANMGASKQWLFTKYDKFGRAVYTGIFTSSYNYGSEGRQAEQNNANNTATVQNESRSTTGFAATGVTAYYTNNIYPTAFTKILSIHYFDTYPAGSPERQSQIFSSSTIGDNMGAAVNTKNLPTASYVKNIEDDNWTKSYIWYDNKARAIGTHSMNHLGGFTKTESSLDFAGVVQQTRITHARLSSDTPKTITQVFEYDAQNRLKKQWHQVDSNVQELLSENTYNELSQIVSKKVGNNLQAIEYRYNIRGAVTQMNDPSSLGKDLFAYSLSYYGPATSIEGRYSGNVQEVNWKSAQDNVLRKYSYQYDNLNRLTKGIYSEPNSSVPENNFYNESVTYDLNSNILSLQRNTKAISGTATQIDNLTYIYANSGYSNRLNTVTDSSTNYNGYPDTSGNLISYDNNGNMTSHQDKGILQIDYNILDLPNYIKFNEYISNRKNKIYVNTTYTYRADGTKLRKIYNYKNSSNPLGLGSKTTDYIDGFQYEYDWNPLNGIPNGNFQLKFVPTSEGYYDFEKNRYIYIYVDHLGNVRLSYFKNTNGNVEVLEENNYYPFGMKHEGYNAVAGNPAYTYAYSGKELQTETGWSDFGARMYMADIGRWGVIDPLSETSRRFSPYNFALNNPVMFIDPDGRKAMAPEVEAVGGISQGGIAQYLATGGRAQWGSFEDFLTAQSPFGYMKDWKPGGGGGGGSSASGIYSIYNGQGVTMTGIYAQMLFQFLKDNITADGILNIKGFHFVMESKTPNIYKHTLSSFLKGYPEILHYDKDVARKTQRRREATGALPTKSGMHKDEYPYASTFEGGKNANVAYVPAAENFSQGGSLGVLYGTLQHGDAFMVIPVPADEEPETAKQRSLSRLPQSAPVFVPDTPNFARPTVPYNMWPVILGAGVIIGVGSYMRFAPIP